jgi:hypothetical protein
MPSDSADSRQPIVRLPTRMLPFCLFTAWLLPFLARLPSIPIRGWGWLLDYMPGGSAILLISGANSIPGILLYALGRGSKRAPTAFWLAASAGAGFLLWAHGTLNLRSSSTAAIALLFIPLYGAGVVLAGWVIGLIAHALLPTERARAWLAVTAGTAAVMVGAGLAAHDSIAIAKRESRFPGITVRELPLLKRPVYTDRSLGGVEVLSRSAFDAEPGDETAVLGASGLALLQTKTYVVKSTSAFAREDCEGCVGMYPYLVPDGKGHVLVTSSDGLSDRSGHLLWPLKASGFTRLLPIQLPDRTPTFFSYQNGERIDRHSMDGKVLWSVRVNVNDIGSYITPEGEELPFALTGYGEGRELAVYDLGGTLRKRVRLPEWASEVKAVGWPVRGNLLVGTAGVIGVLDSEGREVLRHAIQGTSFDPYHGPDGVAVRFAPTEAPYLAVMSHGSSGYARSVLLIFDPKGRLVWQEELNKLRAILAAPEDDHGEVLLVGGMDGILEYRLDGPTASRR